jgi:hypothetical protein
MLSAAEEGSWVIRDWHQRRERFSVLAEIAVLAYLDVVMRQ